MMLSKHPSGSTLVSCSLCDEPVFDDTDAELSELVIRHRGEIMRIQPWDLGKPDIVDRLVVFLKRCHLGPFQIRGH